MTQLELKLANSNRGQQRQLQNYRAHKRMVFSVGTCREGFLPQCVDEEATLRMHCTHDRQSFVSLRLSILILSN